MDVPRCRYHFKMMSINIDDPYQSESVYLVDASFPIAVYSVSSACSSGM